VLVDGVEVGPLAARGAGEREVALSDGSKILLDPGAAIDPLDNSDTGFSVLVVQGRVTFDIRPGGPRRWTVECGLATVDVIGTRFTVERETRSVSVTVERGIVLMRGERVPDRVQRLAAGQTLKVDDVLLSGPETAMREQPGLSSASPAKSATPASPVPSAPSGGSAWRGLEQRGDHTAAYAELGPAGIVSASRGASVEELLSLADVARLSGHPADAVIPLNRLLTEHGDHPTAPLAAFTLGRLQLDALGHPALAAEAFARALALGLPQSLQEDAYARLVEARARAGDSSGASAAAQDYERRFPAGKRLAEVRRWTVTP
jgi:transmembrane sensor